MNNQTYTASCFGKLPNFGDFVKYKAASSEMQAFDTWLQQGMIAAKRQLGNMFDSCWYKDIRYYFLFCPPHARQFLVGVFKTSMDKSERKFPFIVSLKVHLASFNLNYNLYIPLLFNSFFERANNLLNQNLHELGYQEISAKIENLSFPFISDYSHEISGYQDYLANTTSEQFLAAQFGEFESLKKYITFGNLTDMLLPLHNSDISRMPIGFQILLNHIGLKSTYSICFWQEIILRLSHHSKNVLPILFWTSSELDNQSSFYINFRIPPAKNFINLLKPDFENDMIYRFENPGSQNVATLVNNLSVKYKSLLDDRQKTLNNFLLSI